MTTDLSNTEQLPASLFTPTPQAAQHITNHLSPRTTMGFEPQRCEKLL